MILIFLTGAVVLALEVLSSRIMTPYFGVSLYIWAGILSITLTFLAVGYCLGGYATRRFDRSAHAMIFLALPVASASAIIVACALYPLCFPALAQFDLIIGSFIASAVLLAFPLIALSAMNPLLIALRGSETRPGDGGAGQVFFVSTVGSVAGVVATAFVIIPNLTNFRALLWLAMALCIIVALASLKAYALPLRHKIRLAAAAAIVAAVSGIFVFGQARYLDLLTKSDDPDIQLAILGEYTSVFGNVKAVDFSSKSDRFPPIKLLLQDGAIQNRTSRDNQSLSMYTYVLERLTRAFAPDAETALVLGLGAGIVPLDLVRRGLEVSIVDINRDVVTAAQEHFNFDHAKFSFYLEDARIFVRNCEASFDVVIVDLFLGDGAPDYLMTKEFFGDLRHCIRPCGIVVLNAFFDFENEEPNKRLLATIDAAFGRVFAFQATDINFFVVGTTSPPQQDVTFSLKVVPAALLNSVRKSLEAGKVINREMLRGYEPFTDRHNVYASLIANARMKHRKDIVANLQPRILLN